MYVVFRFNKGYGDSRIYYRLRTADTHFYNFDTRVFDTVESVSTKIFLKEVEDPQDPWESIYEGEIPVNMVGWFEEEILDSLKNKVIGEGMSEFRTTYFAKTKTSIQLSKGPIRFKLRPPRINFRITTPTP